jgi:hypothetical protein
LASWLDVLDRNVEAIEALTEALDVLVVSDDTSLEQTCRVRIKLMVQHLACQQFFKAKTVAADAITEARASVVASSKPPAFLFSLLTELTDVLRPVESEIAIEELYSLAASSFSPGISSQIWSARVISDLMFFRAHEASIGYDGLASAISSALLKLRPAILDAEKDDDAEVTGEARRTIRRLYQDLQAVFFMEDVDLPPWVTVDLPADWMNIISGWLNAPDVDARRAWMDSNQVDVKSGGCRQPSGLCPASAHGQLGPHANRECVFESP